MITSSGRTLEVNFLQAQSFPEKHDSRLETVERRHIKRVLEECGWKIKGEGNAASRLGLKPSTLRARMKRLGIERPV